MTRRALAIAASAAALAIAGCASAPERPAPERQSQPPAAPSAKAGASARRGGYYLDDGPGESPPPDLERVAEPVPRLEPLIRAANMPYSVFGQQYVPFTHLVPYRERGIASWYGRKFHGQRTASGEPYDMYAMTGAHPTLPIPSYARVTNLENGRSVIVRINDRGPFFAGRIIDLSYAAAWKLGYAAKGSARVEVDALLPPFEEAPPLEARDSPAAAPATAAPNSPATVASVTTPAIPIEAAAGGVYLQLGAFASRENAENLRARLILRLSWIDQAIETLYRDGLFRVYLGPYPSRGEASAVAQKIRAALELQPMLILR